MKTLLRADQETQEVIATRTASLSRVGLCRTEPMFIEVPSLPWMRLLASTVDSDLREAALAALLPLHKANLASVLRVLAPKPVHVRLLNLSLEKFLPSSQQLKLELSCARADEDWDTMFSLANLRCQHDDATPNDISNPGWDCRPDLRDMDVLRMQLSALFEAMVAVAITDTDLEIGILLPMISSEEETRLLVALVRAVSVEVFATRGLSVPYKIGAQLETPRSALCAGAIARWVDFVSFGLSELTAALYGVSQQDACKYTDQYVERGVFRRNPFATLDYEGAGLLLTLAVSDIRKEQPSIKIGVCGDHPRNVESLHFLETLGVDFICSNEPFLNLSEHKVFQMQAA